MPGHTEAPLLSGVNPFQPMQLLAKLRQALPTALIILYKEAGWCSPTALKSCLIHVFCTQWRSVSSMPLHLSVTQHYEALSSHTRHRAERNKVLSTLRSKLPQPQGLALKASPQLQYGDILLLFLQCKIPTYLFPIHPSPWKEINCKQPATRGTKS